MREVLLMKMKILLMSLPLRVVIRVPSLKKILNTKKITILKKKKFVLKGKFDLKEANQCYLLVYYALNYLM